MEGTQNKNIEMFHQKPTALLAASSQNDPLAPLTDKQTNVFPPCRDTVPITKILQHFPRRFSARRRPLAGSSVELTLRFHRYLAQRASTKRKSRGFSGAMNFVLTEVLGNYIDANIGERIQIADMAAIANLSVGHFHHAFSATMGVAPHAYVMIRRIELARDLVESTDASLIKIGQALGFNDSPHFSREFRRRIGASPSEWRRLSRMTVDE
jgi:AraC-like DNA-binding protein